MKNINQLFYFRTEYKTKLVLLILYLGFINISISQEFTGYIYKKINNQISIEKKERHELMQKQFGIFKGISYESFIGRKFIFIVCTRDTIIKFSNYKDVPIPYITVEIGKNTFVKGIVDDNFVKLGKFSGYPNHKIKKTNKTYVINGYKTVLFELSHKDYRAKYYVKEDFNQSIPGKENESNSTELFFRNGIILKTESISKIDKSKDTTEIYEIRKEACVCKRELEKLNFDFNLLNTEAIKDIPFPVMKEKDYSIIEEGFRSLIQVQFFDKLDNKKTEEIFLGHYTYIDLWATWCKPCLYAMPSLGDLYEKYQYQGLRVASISLDGSTATEKWKKAIEKENIYWDNYMMPEGFDSVLCRQLGIKAIPHYILLDPDGKIMLENAPGPSDPMIHDVLVRIFNKK